METSEYLRVVTADEPVPAPPANPALVTGYEPDRFQKFAIEAIEAGDNVLVTAKTGSGKTFVGEYQIAKSIQRGGRVFYTTPIKSLSNQKFHDLKQLFPDTSVGIMTGDIKFRPDAQIIIMTTEILRNLLFKKGTVTESVGTTALLSLEGLDAVIFDEVHYINDKDRGHVWEETLMLLPPSIHLILLSATLSSPQVFANWLGSSKKVRVWLISTLWRAVPLEHCVLSDSKPLLLYDSKECFHADVYRAWLTGNKQALLAHDKFKEKVHALKADGHTGPVGGKARPKTFEYQLNECLNWLDTHGNLPAIVFVFSRLGCEKLAGLTTSTFLDSSDAAAVAHIWDFHLKRYGSMLEKSPQAHRLRELAMRGIAYHHSGLLPFLKEILEVLFSKGYIKVLFATETFAVGINMPTKTVIFTAVEKYTDGSIRPLASSEYIQMAGRAGRRGKDTKGLVLYLPQRDPVPVHELQAILTGKSASFSSRMTFDYDFIMKSLNGSSLQSDTLLQGSYWWALEQQEVLRAERELAVLLKKVGEVYLTAEERDACDVKTSIETRIQESQNAKKKAAVRELEAWKSEHKDSLWAPVLARYRQVLELEQEIRQVRNYYNDCVARLSGSIGAAVPSVMNRLRVLEEFGYVTGDLGKLSDRGVLASEIHEGHPFLMTESMLRIHRNPSLTVQDILLVLSVFLGEAKDDEKLVKANGLGSKVKAEIEEIRADSLKGMEIERRAGLIPSAEFWTVNEEWVEPMEQWLAGEHSIASLAAAFDMHEGNIQKALMKLASLLEEFQAMASLLKDVELLKVLEGGRQLIVRDLILAESLYLRI